MRLHELFGTCSACLRLYADKQCHVCNLTCASRRKRLGPSPCCDGCLCADVCVLMYTHTHTGGGRSASAGQRGGATEQAARWCTGVYACEHTHTHTHISNTHSCPATLPFSLQALHCMRVHACMCVCVCVCVCVFHTS